MLNDITVDKNGKPIRSYVELGIQCVMLKKSCADELGLLHEYISRQLEIRGFGDESVTILGKITVELKIYSAISETDVLVIPDIKRYL